MSEEMIRKILTGIAVLAMLAGAGAAVMMLPFTLSSNGVNVLGAGFGMLVGAMLFGSGLVTLTILYARK